MFRRGLEPVQPQSFGETASLSLAVVARAGASDSELEFQRMRLDTT